MHFTTASINSQLQVLKIYDPKQESTITLRIAIQGCRKGLSRPAYSLTLTLL